MTEDKSKKNFGVDHETHHLLEIRQPPEALVALRNELPYHKDIYEYAIQGKNFEDCMAKIGEKLDIVLDGLYDGDKLCEVLVTALRNRRFHGNQPHLRHPALVSAEIIERKGVVSLDRAEEIGTIAATAAIPIALVDMRPDEVITEYTKIEGGSWLPWPKKVYNKVSAAKVKHDKEFTKVVKIYGIVLHALKTDRGRIWDAINQWRFEESIQSTSITEISLPQEDVEIPSADSGNPEEEHLPSLSESADSEDSSGSGTIDLPQKH